MNQQGFTLAEVLVTLAIIGVVAAMSIPGLTNNTQNHEYVVALKKAYASGNLALQKAAVDECGTADLSCIFTLTQDEIDYDMGDTSSIKPGSLLVKYFNVAKNCGLDSGCWTNPHTKLDKSGGIREFDDNSSGMYYYKFTTSDGMSFAIEGLGNCNLHVSSNTQSPLYNGCGVLYVDVNGKKGPNIEGRDVFAFLISSNKAPLLYPSGGKDYIEAGGSYWDNRCNPPDYILGDTCTARIMEKGWVMDY